MEESTEVTPDGQMTGLDWAPVEPSAATAFRRTVGDRPVVCRAGYWNDRELRDGLEAAGSLRPDAVGLIDNRRSLTWGRPGSTGGHCGVTLTELGVSTCDPVLLIAENSAAGVIAYHGLLRIGARAVLLDRRCGTADVRAALDVVVPKLVIIPNDECDRLGPEWAAVI